MRSTLSLLFIILLLVVKISQAQNYVAEGYFVIDDSAVQNYIREMNSTISYAIKYQKALEKIQKDVAYVVNQVNSILTSVFRFGYNIEIRIRRHDVLNVNIAKSFSLGTNNVIDSTVALETFQHWLIEQNLYETLQFDFAVYWTGFDLFGSIGVSKHYDGVVGGICSGPAAVAIVEFQPTYRDVVGTAHAIAMMLGAGVDGLTSTYISSYINLPNHPNRWAFSSCSAYNIKDYLAQLKPNCLLNTNSLSIKPTMPYTTYDGDLFNPDVICQRSLNDSRSYMCKSLPQVYNYLPPKGNAVCSQIYCYLPDTKMCTPVYSSDGMICDYQKRCTGGACLLDKTPFLEGSCIWGDQKTLDLPEIPFQGSCQSYISKYGSISCYFTPINESCCATCKSYSTSRSGCEYGDRSSECVKFPRTEICQKNRTLCCAYCDGYIGKRSTSPEISLNITAPYKPSEFQILPYLNYTNKRY